MQTKVMECKSHNIAIHLFSNGANDDVFYLRGATDRVCLGNAKLGTQRVSGWPSLVGAGVVTVGAMLGLRIDGQASVLSTFRTSPSLLSSRPQIPSFWGINRTFRALITPPLQSAPPPASPNPTRSCIPISYSAYIGFPKIWPH